MSHGNQGVYFEAGFAEGLEKKVIYIIDHQVWVDEKERKKMVHFDTEHHTILRWSKDDPKIMDEFKRDLKAIIRNEFPDKAS